MPPPTSNKRSTAGIERYLLPREVPVAVVRQHPAMLIPPSALALGGLLVVGFLNAVYLHGKVALGLWALWLLLFLRLVWKVLQWSVDYFAVTSERLLLAQGFFTRRVNMLPMGKVTEMSFKRTFAGRLLGYGEFILESAGPDQALQDVPYIPYPEQLYLLICEILFPSSADDIDDSPGQPSSVMDDGY
jgi:membrane protein YdbS with pleckstrin-like domain